jgi:hypothetical protein
VRVEVEQQTIDLLGRFDLYALCGTRRCLKEALDADAQHQDGDVIAEGLILEVQHGVLYTADDRRSVESKRVVEDGLEPLFTEEEAIWGPSFDDAIGVED